MSAAAPPLVGRDAELRALERALDAGFSRVDVLPVDNDFFRLYRLDP
jgi:hypothetical protein